MSYSLFLDDERYPPNDDKDWVIVRSFAAAVDYVQKNGYPKFVSFDHDLGDGPTGLKFALWLVDRDLDRKDMPDDFSYYVHSQNPIGALNISTVFKSYLDFKKRHKK